MAEEKKPRLLKDPGDWWKVSRYVPEGKQDVVLLVTGGLAAFLLVLTVIAFTELATSGGESKEAEGHVEKLEAELEAARGEIANQREAAANARDETRKVEEKAAKLAADLDAAGIRLSEAETDIEQTSGMSDRLDALVRTRDQEIDGVNSELARTKKRLAEAMKYKKEAADLERQLRETQVGLAAFRDQSAEVLGQKAGLETVLLRKIAKCESLADRLTTKLQEREHEIQALADRNEEVEAELRKFPTEPFSDEDAARTYRNMLDEVAEHTDRVERIAILFRAKLLLAGTSYESKAHVKWRKEQAEKQADVDRDAAAVYENARSRTRMHPEAYDKNIAILEEASKQVRGSKKFEQVIQRHIDRLHEEKARVRVGD